MESTTLVTFMLHHPTARHVDLLGSWDNFSEPWEMKRDLKRGDGNWSGCHKFRNIICDGDGAGMHERRNGGLKMGGTYWYYYRIDHDDEYYDPSQPSTTCCPLLPGQHLNVLEVPKERRFISRSRSSSISLITHVHTMDPEDRYVTPRPAPKPKLPKLITNLEVDDEKRPWTASLPSKPDSGIVHRQVKSASSLPASVFSMAVAHLKSPGVVFTPSVGGRGRSRILHSKSVRTQRTKSPSSRELRGMVGGGNISAVDIGLLPTTPLRTKSREMESQGISIFVPKRRDAFNKTVQLLLEAEGSRMALEKLPDTQMRGRAVTMAQTRLSVQHQRAKSEEQFVLQRSVSAGRLREPSPLRLVSRGDEEAKQAIRIPEGIVEVEEGPLSPRLNNKARPYSVDNSELGSPAPTRTEFQFPLPPNTDFNKELPALPSYLVPPPLFAKTARDEDVSYLDDMDDSLQFQQSRFSMWSTGSTEDSAAEADDDDAEDTEDADVEADRDALSSTFSSIHDWASGETSPNLLFEHMSPLHQPVEEDVGGKANHHGDSWHRLGNVNVNVEDNGKPREITQIQRLIDEFDFLGAALI